jgi:hypothetical protein
MSHRGTMWVGGIGLLVALVVIGGIYIGRVSHALSHVMTFNTNVPTVFNSDPTFFCSALHQPGGLQQMVDNAGGSTARASTVTADQVLLKAVVEASPNQSTRTAMVRLYKDVLNGSSTSSQAQGLVDTVEEMNPCTG